MSRDRSLHSKTDKQGSFPNTSIWITEYAYANQDLEDTQDFYNESAAYFDRLDYIERYSYFGAFRSKTSNVGPNVPFLNNDGDLTDIGSWYLGFGNSTGVLPTSGNPAMPNRACVDRAPGLLMVLMGLLSLSVSWLYLN